ncbi:alpha-amylase family glycosyl hydrolase [Anaerocolumna sp. MB42-C2]|uniref:alpha-amylase family glycosyl hydrolase n=1 Tax=Anaerocolumna sp. MB42-C2 TaxID=3070997 RepID=UPI0027E16E42|nr:alpha-amylase family glycosyl hydrolase [Anaerocolumna sp. MB42-C2]WMJ87554.1 alpha-amylase family glycosyl hydrolase [Anaerocolumna sp. MB42-C2]
MAKKSKSGFILEKGNPLLPGVTVLNNGINFAVSVYGSDTCCLNLYDKDTGSLRESVVLTNQNRTGNVFSVLIKNLDINGITYTYQVRNKEFIDPYVKQIYGRELYGKVLSAEETKLLRGGIYQTGFSWQGEWPLHIPYSKLIIYKLHVRGFTRHPSSGVTNGGTFLGVVEKIPHLKELGVNCLQLMPIYEYNEIIGQNGFNGNHKMNYWGYSNENYYFAPKASYCAEPSHQADELKYMIDTLHKNGIEVIMEMNFVKGLNPGFIQDCLRFWYLEYHLDGFKVSSETVPGILIGTDPILGKVKLLAEGWDVDRIYPKDMVPDFKNLAEYNSGFSVDTKRFLRGDEEQTPAVANRMKKNPDKCGVINYITNHDGFTLMDLYSYDVKHNEKNGENNQDGADYNYSWNCGTEGKTQSKKVRYLRKKQIRNALLLLFLSQGTPLLLAGDEFGNSQEGNNNAYCQDNEISWLDWDLLEQNKSLFQFVKQLIKLRTEHPILHMEEQLRNMDYIACGLPDISFHGIKAWYPDYSHYSRVVGVMLAGNYVKINRNENDRIFYLGFNMHWENHGFDLPKLPAGKQWYVLYNSNTENNIMEEQLLINQRIYEIPARTAVVLISK